MKVTQTSPFRCSSNFTGRRQEGQDGRDQLFMRQQKTEVEEAGSSPDQGDHQKGQSEENLASRVYLRNSAAHPSVQGAILPQVLEPQETGRGKNNYAVPGSPK